MLCWFRRSTKGEWISDVILGYTGVADSACAVIRVGSHGELVAVPLSLVSAGDNRPADGHEHYRDPRCPVTIPLDEPKAQAATKKAFKEAGGK